MKKNIKKPTISDEDFENIKGQLLATGIINMAQASKLSGYKIVQALAFCMVDVIYKTASKRDKKIFEKAANNIRDVILESLLNYEELIKEKKEGKPNE